MATLTKTEYGWKAQVRRKGVSKTLTFRTKTEAAQWALQLELEIESGDYNKTANIPFSDVINRYLREITPKKRSRRNETLRLYRLLEMPIAKVNLRDLTDRDFKNWRDSRLSQVSSASVHREWSTLGNMMNIAHIEWKLIDHNPLKGVRKPETPKPRTRRYSQDEINSLIYASGFSWTKAPDTCTARVGIAILFAIETAMRAGEIVGLTWQHIHRERRIAHLPETKNGYARDVPLSSEALRLLDKLEEIKQGESVFQLRSANLDALFRKLKTRCQLENLHFHDTRREALTRLAKKLSVMELAKMSGHRDLSILQNTYYTPDMAEVAQKLD